MREELVRLKKIVTRLRPVLELHRSNTSTKGRARIFASLVLALLRVRSGRGEKDERDEKRATQGQMLFTAPSQKVCAPPRSFWIQNGAPAVIGRRYLIVRFNLSPFCPVV